MKKMLMTGILIGVVVSGFISCTKEKDIEIDKPDQKKINLEHAIYVTSPGENNDIRPNLQKTIDTAKNGDVLVLPDGNFAFSSYINTSKKISIIGGGIDKTMLFRPDSTSDNSLQWKPMIKFSVNSDDSSGIVVSGIYFKGKSIASNSQAIDHGLQFYHVVDFVVHDCKFENFGEEGILVIHKDNIARGLIYNCQFYHNYKGEYGLGYGYGIAIMGEDKSWVNSPKYGSSNFIFVEDNTFQYHKHSITSGHGGLYVARYNKIMDNICGFGAIDMHEARDMNGFSSRASEIYNNTIINSKFENGSKIVAGLSSSLLVLAAILVRGGEAVIYNNTTSGYRYGLYIVANNYLSGSYPIKTQSGYNSALSFGENDLGDDPSHSDGDLFIWNNKHTVYDGIDPTPWFLNSSLQYLRENRDYHFSAKAGYVPYPYPHPLRSE